VQHREPVAGRTGSKHGKYPRGEEAEKADCPNIEYQIPIQQSAFTDVISTMYQPTKYQSTNYLRIREIFFCLQVERKCASCEEKTRGMHRRLPAYGVGREGG
jgi:hypothetical protein